MDLSVSYIYGESWELATKHGLKVIALLLISIIVSVGMNLLTLSPDFISNYVDAISSGNAKAMERLATQSDSTNTLVAIGITLLQYAITFAISCATYALLIGCIRERCTSIMDAVKSLPITSYLKFIAAECLYGLVVFIGFILLVVPGVYLGIRLAWAPYYIAENKDASIGEAFRWSWQASEGRVLELIGLAFVTIAIFAGTVIVCSLSFFIASLIGGTGIFIFAIVGIAAITLVSVIVTFAQAKVYCEMSCDSEDRTVSDC